jgi:vancomycin resistance protein VanJ
MGMRARDARVCAVQEKGSNRLSENKRTYSLIVKCSGEGHRVRLDPRRLWASARCPSCKSAVDPTRIRRVLALAALMYMVTAESTSKRILVVGTWAYAAGVLLLAFGLWQWADRWWLMTVVLFGPRWLIVLPLLVLLPMAFKLNKRMMIPLLVTAVVALGPIMGFRIGVRRWFGSPPDSLTLRVATFNAASGATLRGPLSWVLNEINAEIVAFQECGPELQRQIEQLPELSWYHHSDFQMCLLSRFPIRKVDQMDRETLELAGASGFVIRHAIEIGDTVVNVTNLHLDTPRQGLEPLRFGAVRQGLGTLRSKSFTREIESRQGRAWVNSAKGPLIVLGDFNMPVESTIYRQYWGDLSNAFSQVGFGFGSTRLNGWIRVRIDHVLLGDDWRVVKAFVGPNLGSDHRPMIAHVVLSGSP